MKNILYVAILLATNLLLAQTENDKKIFLDSLQNQTIQGNHTHYRIVKDYYIEQEKYKFYEYSSSGELIKEGYTTKLLSLSLEGEIKEYYKKGGLKRVFNAINSKKIGPVTEWYENGKLKFEGEYIDDPTNHLENKLKLINFWGITNNQTLKDGNGKVNIDNDEIEEKGEVKNYQKTGNWTGFDKNLNLKFSEVFEEGKLIQGNSIDRDGNEYTYTSTSTSPQPKEGFKEFYTFIGNNIKLPPVREEINNKVVLCFVVNKEGEITEIEVIKSIRKNIDDATIRVLQKYGNWNPGTIKGKNVKVRFALPFKVIIK